MPTENLTHNRIKWKRGLLRGEELRELLEARPKTRADCRGGFRPCPWVGCRYNLYLHINAQGGIVTRRGELEAMGQTCALDIAEANPDGLSQTEVARLMGYTRERIRQIELKAFTKLLTKALELVSLETTERVGGNRLQQTETEGTPSATDQGNQQTQNWWRKENQPKPAQANLHALHRRAAVGKKQAQETEGPLPKVCSG